MKYAFLGVFIGIVVLAVGYIAGQLHKAADFSAPSKDEWCEVGEVVDGMVVYNQAYAGATDFIVVSTIEGPKLYTECK